MTTHPSLHAPDNLAVCRQRVRRYHTFAMAYDLAASGTSDSARRLAVVSAALGAVVSSSIFASANAGDIGSAWIWITAVVSLSATVTAAIAASLGYGDAANRYRQAALKCVQLQHRSQDLIAKGDVTNDEVSAFDDDAIAAEATMAVVPERYYRKAAARCEAHRDEDEFESSLLEARQGIRASRTSTPVKSPA